MDMQKSSNLLEAWAFYIVQGNRAGQERMTASEDPHACSRGHNVIGSTRVRDKEYKAVLHKDRQYLHQRKYQRHSQQYWRSAPQNYYRVPSFWKGARERTYMRKPASVGILQHLRSEQPQAALEINEDEGGVHNVEQVEDSEGQNGEQLLSQTASQGPHKETLHTCTTALRHRPVIRSLEPPIGKSLVMGGHLHDVGTTQSRTNWNLIKVMADHALLGRLKACTRPFGQQMKPCAISSVPYKVLPQGKMAQGLWCALGLWPK